MGPWNMTKGGRNPWRAKPRVYYIFLPSFTPTLSFYGSLHWIFKLRSLRNTSDTLEAVVAMVYKSMEYT